MPSAYNHDNLYNILSFPDVCWHHLLRAASIFLLAVYIQVSICEPLVLEQVVSFSWIHEDCSFEEFLMRQSTLS